MISMFLKNLKTIGRMREVVIANFPLCEQDSAGFYRHLKVWSFYNLAEVYL